jgi:hypothetical protein
MTDATDRLSPPAFAAERDPEDTEQAAGRQRLLVVSPPAGRAAGPGTNLANVFERFAETQHALGDQLVGLDGFLQQQGQQITELSAQLPDMKERINWLISSYYEDGRDARSFGERLARQEVGLAALTDTVRSLCEAQNQWKQTIEQLLQILARAHTVPVSPPAGEPA